jgi:hypothetical protein
MKPNNKFDMSSNFFKQLHNMSESKKTLSDYSIIKTDGNYEKETTNENLNLSLNNNSKKK